MSNENIEIFYDIKAMFVEACKNPQFNAYANGTISTILGKVLNINGFTFNYTNRYFEVTVVSDEVPMVVVGVIKSVLSQFISTCIRVNEISNILSMINNETYSKFYNMIKDDDQIELFKITNYMYSILFMGNTPTGHLFRIMM